MEIGGVAAAADGDGHRPREDTHSSVVVTLTLSLKSNLNMKSCTNAAEPNLTSVFTLFRRSGSDSHRLTHRLTVLLVHVHVLHDRSW